MTGSSPNRDRVWIAIVAASFVFGLAVSWLRWSSPIIDTGREMNQPLRLAAGETLYADVRHIYGPLSPWLHAALYRAFGPSLTILYADGIFTAAIVIALVYMLARRVMDSAAAGAAALSVTWLCVLKTSGNYILPYSYNALHGTALGLLSLMIVTSDPRRASGFRFLSAGLVAGLATLAKTEVGLTAVAAGTVAGFLATRPDFRQGIGLAAVFVAAAAGVTAAVYVVIAAKVGWSRLLSDSWLLAYNIPSELAYYNSRISGFDKPLASAGRMILAALKLGIVGTIAACTSVLVAARGVPARDAAVSRARRGLAAAGVLLLVLGGTTGLDLDTGPYLAMPIVLGGLLVVAARQQRDRFVRFVLIVYSVYALASLARIILHVRSGGAYGSFLLPVSVILFTYIWVGPFVDAFADVRTRRVARSIGLGLMLTVTIGQAIVLTYRYRRANFSPVSTARGTMMASADEAQAFNEAIAYLDAHTRPGDAVAVMPEGTTIDFLSGRRNPLREEIVTPGYLDAAGEARAIRQLEDAHTRVILITNRLTEEFGPAVFGRDYCRQLMAWIDAHFTVCAMFGPVKDRTLQIGDKPFFIRAYCACPTGCG